MLLPKPIIEICMLKKRQSAQQQQQQQQQQPLRRESSVAQNIGQLDQNRRLPIRKSTQQLPSPINEQIAGYNPPPSSDQLPSVDKLPETGPRGKRGK
jgi:hypothetical protein